MKIINEGLKFNNLTYGNIPNKIVLHNADASNCTVQDIHQWHLNNGWSGIGYHYYVRKDGSIYKGRPDNVIGSHCKGSNTGSLGICFEGRYMKETMSQTQYNAGIELIKYLFNKYGALAIYGHRELYNTDCPGTNFPLQDFKNVKEHNSGTWKQDTVGWWYVYSDGNYPKSQWFKVEEDWYYADEKGYCYQNRWLKHKNNWYYFKDNCKMTNNETLTYKFNSNGEWING